MIRQQAAPEWIGAAFLLLEVGHSATGRLLFSPPPAPSLPFQFKGFPKVPVTLFSLARCYSELMVLSCVSVCIRVGGKAKK